MYNIFIFSFIFTRYVIYNIYYISILLYLCYVHVLLNHLLLI